MMGNGNTELELLGQTQLRLYSQITAEAGGGRRGGFIEVGEWQSIHFLCIRYPLDKSGCWRKWSLENQYFWAGVS